MPPLRAIGTREMPSASWVLASYSPVNVHSPPSGDSPTQIWITGLFSPRIPRMAQGPMCDPSQANETEFWDSEEMLRKKVLSWNSEWKLRISCRV